MPQSQMLELTHEKLGWPESGEIWNPSGAGPKVYAGLAKKKIGEKIKREFPEETEGIKVGVLAANPRGDNTEAPLAIICQFTRPVSNPQLLQRLHQLAWSFCRARSLIIVEPQLLRVWSCCEPPEENTPVDPVFEETDLSSQAANALQWVELVSGEFFQKNESRFKRTGAADQMLLSNLKELRRQLENDGLAIETIHDLLARIIFIQFLFQKQDTDGKPALNDRVLSNLHKQGILSAVYTDLPDILNNFDDAYNLFRWLNDKFNGDLFPGKGKTEPERQADWQAEIQKVYTEDNRYLTKLAEFVRGDLDMGNNQLCLWKFYSFDVIPLDFISSIYEEFVQKDNKPKKSTKSIKQPKINNSVHYTPEYIVDFILDGVLPWNEINWDLKILDPACGSGIFLVKAFQRLIYRWELAHNKRISAEALRALLENNLFGIDIEKEAVRVASFSLYMTMLDSIDPLEYWENEVSFPPLRGYRLIAEDFFREDKEGLRTGIDANTYDLVLGNAPWGKNSVKNSAYAEAWKKRVENHGKWQDSCGNIGPLFLPKASALTKLGGIISMIQPAMSLLFNQSGPAKIFREQLFSEFKIEEIINLSALRFGIFKDAISPSCVITLRNLPPDSDPLTYICPKPNFSDKDCYHLIIENQDINYIYLDEIFSIPSIWATLTWGGRRDLNLIQYLNRFSNLERFRKDGVIIKCQGIQKGQKEKEVKDIIGKPILNETNFPVDTFIVLNSDSLPVNSDPKLHSPTDFSAFYKPQMILKQTWKKEQNRFQAAIIKSNNIGMTLCSENYITIHLIKTKVSQYSWLLEIACLTYISKLAVYYLFLTSGRFASYRPEPNVEDFLQVPIPNFATNPTEGIEKFDFNAVDQKIFDAFLMKDSERILIEDICNYTLLDFKGNHSSPGREKTSRHQEQELTDYCECFFRVIKAGFGQDKDVCATIFQEPDNSYLPVRLVAIHLNQPIHKGVKIEPIDSQNLLERLQILNDLFLQQDMANVGGIFYQRVARIYESYQWQGEQVPTIYLIKPDKIRYWTRSMALRDADEVSADIMSG